MLGSEKFVTEGSTIAGPGLTLNVRRESTENQMRPPAILGMVTLTVLPGLPRAIATSWVRVPTADDVLLALRLNKWVRRVG
jgi:hypothetical protein